MGILLLAGCATTLVSKGQEREVIYSRTGIGPNGEQVVVARIWEDRMEKTFFSDGRISFTSPDAKVWQIYGGRMPDTWKLGNRINYWKLDDGAPGIPILLHPNLLINVAKMYYPDDEMAQKIGPFVKERKFHEFLNIDIYSVLEDNKRDVRLYVQEQLLKLKQPLGGKLVSRDKVELGLEKTGKIGEIEYIRFMSKEIFLRDGKTTTIGGQQIVFSVGGITYWIGVSPRHREIFKYISLDVDEFVRRIKIPAEPLPESRVPLAAPVPAG